jgi:hypothetical protein
MRRSEVNRESVVERNHKNVKNDLALNLYSSLNQHQRFHKIDPKNERNVANNLSSPFSFATINNP